MLTTIAIFGVVLYLGNPQFAYLISASVLVALPLMIYLFSQQIATQLLDSRECTSARINAALVSLTGRVMSPLPKVEIADPLVLGTNAFTTGPSPSRSIVIVTENIDKLPSDEISAILAHELGHVKNWHPLKLTLVNMASTALLVFFPWPEVLPLVFVGVLLVISLIAKIFETEADVYSTKLTGPYSLSSALLKAGEEATHRQYALELTVLGKSRPIDDIKESLGVRRPRSGLRRLLLWVFSSHPPLYYRIAILNKHAGTRE